MPIEIEAPDGGIVEFPEGMSDADIHAAMSKHFGGSDSSAATGGTDYAEAAKTFGNEAANAASLNLWRNSQAAYDSYMNGKPFDEAYDQQKKLDEARLAAHPAAGYGGMAAGVILPALATGGVTAGAELPVLAGQAYRSLPTAGRVGEGLAAAAKSAAYGGVQGGVSEALDSKDPTKALMATGLGMGLGAVASPVANALGKGAVAAGAKVIGDDTMAKILGVQRRADQGVANWSGGEKAVLDGPEWIYSRKVMPTYNQAQVDRFGDAVQQAWSSGKPLSEALKAGQDAAANSLIQKGTLTPTEKALYEKGQTLASDYGASLLKQLPLVGALTHGVGGAAVGAAAEPVIKAGMKALDQKIIAPIVESRMKSFQRTFSKPWDRPWDVDASGVTGRAAGLLGDAETDKLDPQPLYVRVKPNNR